MSLHVQPEYSDVDIDFSSQWEPCMLSAVYLLTWGKKYAGLKPDEVHTSDTQVSPPC